MKVDLAEVKLGDYKAKLAWFRCTRCQRFTARNHYTLKAVFGEATTMGEVARRIAAEASPPCTLAAGCRVYPEPPPVAHWARLEDALYGRWLCLYHCQRRHASRKAASSCPGPMRLDVPTLVVGLGADFRLDRLYRRARCPKCGSERLHIEWRVPEEPQASEPVITFDAEHLARVAVELTRRKRGLC